MEGLNQIGYSAENVEKVILLFNLTIIPIKIRVLNYLNSKDC